MSLHYYAVDCGNAIASVKFKTHGFRSFHLDVCLYGAGHYSTPICLLADVSHGFDKESGKYQLERVRIDDVYGNGENTERCNQGYGSLLVEIMIQALSQFYVHGKEYYLSPNFEAASICGEVVGRADESESAMERRIHFWNKYFLVECNSDDKMMLRGNMAKAVSVSRSFLFTPMTEYTRAESPSFEALVGYLGWTEKDDETLQLVCSALATCAKDSKLQIRLKEVGALRKKRLRIIQLNQRLHLLPLVTVGLFCWFSLPKEAFMLAAIASFALWVYTRTNTLFGKKTELALTRRESELLSDIMLVEDEARELIEELDISRFGLLSRALAAGCLVDKTITYQGRNVALGNYIRESKVSFLDYSPNAMAILLGVVSYPADLIEPRVGSI